MNDRRPLQDVLHADPYRPPVERDGVLVNEMRNSPTWTLNLACGHTVTRPKRKPSGWARWPAPQRARCDHCPPKEPR